MTAEHWRPIKGYEDRYLISDRGNVFNVWRQKPMALKRYSPYGHLSVGLRRDTQRRFFAVHRLVLIAFSRKPKLGEEARHLNGVPSDNRIANLIWGTRQQNADDRVKHGRSPRGVRNGRAKLTPDDVSRIRDLARQGVYQYVIASQFGVVQSTIGTIVRGVHWR